MDKLSGGNRREGNYRGTSVTHKALYPKDRQRTTTAIPPGSLMMSVVNEGQHGMKKGGSDNEQIPERRISAISGDKERGRDWEVARKRRMGW